MPTLKRGQGRRDIGPHSLQDLQPALVGDRVRRHEQQQRDNEQHTGEHAQGAVEDCSDDAEDPVGVDIESLLDLARADAARLEKLTSLLDEVVELLLVRGQDGREPGDGQHQRRHQAEQDPEDHAEGCRHTQPGRNTLAVQPFMQWMNRHSQHQREEGRADNAGEGLYAGDGDDRGGQPDQDDHRARQSPTGCFRRFCRLEPHRAIAFHVRPTDGWEPRVNTRRWRWQTRGL